MRPHELPDHQSRAAAIVGEALSVHLAPPRKGTPAARPLLTLRRPLQPAASVDLAPACTSSKRCGRCRKDKSQRAFYKNASREDGLSIWCKRCTLTYGRAAAAAATVARIAAKKQEIAERLEHGKACGRCGLVKPLAAFKTDNRCLDGHASTCKECAGPSARAAWTKYRDKQRSEQRGDVSNSVANAPPPDSEARECAAQRGRGE